jgi:hypothetical protein
MPKALCAPSPFPSPRRGEGGVRQTDTEDGPVAMERRMTEYGKEGSN